MELPAFAYHRPESLQEAVSLLSRHSGDVDVVAGGTDLLDHRVRGPVRRAVAMVRAAEIVHDDLGAARREQQRVRLAEAVAGAGHDRDAAVVAKGSHGR